MYSENGKNQTSFQKNNLDQIPKMSVYAINCAVKMLFELEDGSSYVMTKSVSLFFLCPASFVYFTLKKNTGFTPSSVLDQDGIVNKRNG